MKKQRILILTSIVLFLLIPLTAVAGPEVILFSEDFEACIPPDFSVSNGVWDCCLYGSAPDPDGGYFYAGTVCGGNYHPYTDSRLITSEIDLTGVAPAPDEEIILRFRHWFSYEWDDCGYVQISEYDGSSGTWSAWKSISGCIGYGGSSAWTPKTIDLTAYAGEKVKIAFSHTTENDSGTAAGWRIDNIEVVLKSPDLTWDFECGWDDWSASNGVWQVGTPGAGPGMAYSGDQCAGTVLDGSYHSYTNSRLISPAIVLNCTGSISLRFWHWFSYEWDDGGYVQISVYDGSSGTWSAWQSISSFIGYGSSSVWTQITIDLTAYAGDKIKIAFFHTTENDSGTAAGWYIDNIRIECDAASLFPHFCDCDLNQDGACNILDYQQFMQDWGRTDCGTPPGSGLPPNDCLCDLKKDGACNILDYQRFMTDWGNNTCQLCGLLPY